MKRFGRTFGTEWIARINATLQEEKGITCDGWSTIDNAMLLAELGIRGRQSCTIGFADAGRDAFAKPWNGSDRYL